MIEFLFSPQALVYIAGLCYVLGLLIINQIILRLLVLLGTVFYLLYYATVAGDPLWAAIYISLLIGIANVIGLINLIAGQSRLALPREHKDIYEHFATLPPGDFRTLMRCGKRGVCAEDMTLTTERAPLTRLYYVISGTSMIAKKGDEFEAPGGIFIGEVAYLTGQNASATATLTKGSEFIEWRTDDLRHASARSSRFKLALESVLSLDLAQKVSMSVVPHHAIWHPELAFVGEDAS